MSYTNIFGGYNINTAFPSYMNYVISGNLQLNWASSFVDTAPGTNNVTAQINDIAGAAAVIITNNNPISTTLGSGVVIVTIPPNPSLKTGQMVTIAGATTTNSITDIQLNITAAITVINSTSFSYVTAGIAGGGPFQGGGNGVTYNPLPLVTLADATLISVGQTIQFNNVGTNLITISDFLGNQIVQIPPTVNANQFILYLRNNTTQGGTWGVTQLGAGTSQANANALAGNGTISLNSQINTNFPGKTIGANYNVQLNDRASILVWTGGVGTITLPNQIPGFYIAVNNEGSGVVSINTPDATTIDGQASFPLNPSESSYFIGVGANWNTLGFGVESFFQVNVLNPLDLSLVNPSITLTNAQSSRLVQQYTGVLANNVTVFYPAAAGQWYIWNNTTGAFTVSVQLAGPTGNLVQIPQGEKVIIYSDGTSMYNTPTIATSAVFPDGTVGAPGINFQAQNTTGFYRPSSGLVGYSSAGTQGLTFGGPIPGYGLGISGGLAQRYYNATNTNFVGFRAGAVVANQIWTLPLVDAPRLGGVLQSNAAGILSFSNASYPVSTTINQILYSTLNNVVLGLPTANNGVLITSVGGVPSIGNTLPLPVQNNITVLGTIVTGVWNATPVTVPFGGTGLATLTTAYGVVCAGTTPTAPLQNAGVGTASQIFASNGPGVLPSFQNLFPAKVLFFGDTSGASTIFSLNVTSVVNISSGICQINFTIPFSSATNYLSTSTCANLTFTVGIVSSIVSGTNTSSSIQIQVQRVDNSSHSNNTITMDAFGI